LYALIGLGNPGKQYQKTRHNAGFLFLDYLVQRLNIPFRPGKGDYYFSEAGFKQQEILLVKPTTFMNRSGWALQQILDTFPVERENVLIIYDDFQLPFGTLRFRTKGGDGGHNGIKSIIYTLESEQFNRLKIGIGYAFEDSVDFVLSEFNTEEWGQLEKIFGFAYDGLGTFLESGVEQAMNLYNQDILNRDQE